MVGKKKQGGFTLTEAAIVLGVMAVILGAVWIAAGMVWTNFRIEQLNEQLRVTVQNVRKYYAPMGGLPSNASCNGATDITCVLDTNNLIPIEMRVTPQSAGGSIDHKIATLSGGSFHLYAQASSVLRVQLLGLTQPYCLRLLMQMPVLMPEIGVKAIGVASVNSATIDITNIAHPGNPDVLPFSASTAASWCSGKTNEVDIDFKLNP